MSIRKAGTTIYRPMLAIFGTGAVIPISHTQKDLVPRPVMRAVTEVGLYYAIGED